MRRWIGLMIVFVMVSVLRAQDAEPQKPVADYFSDTWLKEHVAQLL